MLVRITPSVLPKHELARVIQYDMLQHRVDPAPMTYVKIHSTRD